MKLFCVDNNAVTDTNTDCHGVSLKHSRLSRASMLKQNYFKEF